MFEFRIASILREVDEADNGAFYMRNRKPLPSNLQKTPPTRNSPPQSRRESHVSFKIAPPATPVRSQQQQSSKIAPINLEDYLTEVILLRRLTEEYNHLISIFDSDDTDLDGYVSTALLSSGRLLFIKETQKSKEKCPIIHNSRLKVFKPE